MVNHSYSCEFRLINKPGIVQNQRS